MGRRRQNRHAPTPRDRVHASPGAARGGPALDVDLLIRGGTVVDGTAGAVGHPGDVAVRDGRIVAVGTGPTGELAGTRAAHTIDARGRVVAPGFIDPHVHSEGAILDGRDTYGSLLQGVTTHLLAPDGFGFAPLAGSACGDLWDAYRAINGRSPTVTADWPTPEAYLDAIGSRSPVNLVPMIPHLSVRFAAMGWADRPATPEELEHMRGSARAWLDAGAVGLNAGLDYAPSISSTTDELVELARLAAAADGIFAAHMRYNGLGLAGAYREMFEIGRKARIPISIAHENIDDVTEALIDEGARDVDLTFESYVYPAGSTHLHYLLPNPDQAGGPRAILARLEDPATRARLAAHLDATMFSPGAAPTRLTFTSSRTGRYIGRSVNDLAKESGISPGEMTIRLLREELPDALLVWHSGKTEAEFAPTTRRTIAHPRMLVISDGIYAGELPHPRGFGCYARIIRHCVRELGAVSLETAIHKMSGLPAERYRIRDRGRIAAGLAADLVIFDPATIADRATWDEPRLAPVGIEAVIVNGHVAVEGGRPSSGLHGRVLRPLQQRGSTS